MATHSNILVWRIPVDGGVLQSMGSQSVNCLTHLFIYSSHGFTGALILLQPG